MNINKQFNLIIFTFILLIFGSMIYYTFLTAGCFVRSDDFRFIEFFLKNYFEGTFQWKMLWQDHHPQPLSGFLFIANAELFDLNMTYTALFGVFFLLPISVLLFISFKNTLNEKNFNYPTLLIFILILMVLFSLNSADKYNWSLVTLSNITILFYISLSYFINKKIIDEDTSFSYIIINIVFLCALDGNASKIFIASIIFILIILLFLNEKKKNIIIIILILLTSLAIEQLFLNWIGFEQKYSQGFIESLINIISRDFFALLKSFSVGLSNGLINYDLLRELNLREGYIEILTISITLIYFYTLFIYFKFKYYEKTIIPFVLIVFSILFLLAVIVYRYPPVEFSPYMISAPRNTKFFELGMIGMIWILGCHYKDNFAKYLLIILYTLIFISQTYYAYKQWNFGLYLHEINKNQALIIRDYIDNNSTRPAEWIIGSEYKIDKQINFLRKYNLNVFSENCK